MKDLMFENLLKKACSDAEDILESHLPDDEVLDHKFTAEFEEKMDGLVDSAANMRPRYMRMFKYAAAILVIAAAAVMLNRGVVDAVKVRLFNYAIKPEDGYTHINLKGESELDCVEPVAPEYLPEGFTIYKEEMHDWIYFVTYGNELDEDGKPKQFIIYDQGLLKNTGMAVSTEDTELKPIVIRDTEGYYSQEDGRCIILWRDDDYHYTLSGSVELEELVKMANSINKK